MEFSRAWEGFNPGEWNEKVNVSDFIKRNYTEYTGDSSFLSGATERTKELMESFSTTSREPLRWQELPMQTTTFILLQSLSRKTLHMNFTLIHFTKT